MEMGLHGAMISGFVAGALSCFGYAKVLPFLASLNVHDTCGVNNLHGMPGILGAVVSIIVTAMHGNGSEDSPGSNDTKGFVGIGADKQVYALLITLGMGLGCGTLAGFLMTVPLKKAGVFVPSEQYYCDALFLRRLGLSNRRLLKFDFRHHVVCKTMSREFSPLRRGEQDLGNLLLEQAF